MAWLAVIRALLLLGGGILGVRGVTVDITDEEYALFPRLFHLDDYDTCMLKENALFCLGELQIQDDEKNLAVRLMKAYSDDFHNFNRTRLHRGYCVSERCPLPHKRAHTVIKCNEKDPQLNHFSSNSPEYKQYQTTENKNSSTFKYCDFNDKRHLDSKLTNSLRFERCVSKYGRKLKLNVNLSSLYYCHTKKDVRRERKVDIHQRVFLWVVVLVLMANVVGTVWDETRSTGKSRSSRLLTAWSVRRNWRNLVGNFPDDDPRLATLLPTEGFRLILVLLVIFVHSGCIHDQLYLGNPRLVERFSHHPIMKLLHNGHSAIQIFVLFSSFLLAQSVIRRSGAPSFWILPKLLVKRILRIAPVYLFVIGYAASWWPRTCEGPLCEPLVDVESAACRNKFWALAFFLGNFVRDDKDCLVQTWYLQVDMQLYIFGLFLTIALSRVRRWALWILGVMFVASCVINGVLAYVRRWTPLMVVAGPESVRALFGNVELFHAFYTKPWASVGSCLVGLFMAHLHHTLQEKGFEPAQHKKLILGCQLVLPLLPCWTGGVGHLCRDISSRGASAVFLAMERPVMSVLAAIVMFGAYNGRTSSQIEKLSSTYNPSKGPSKGSKGFIKHLFSWRGLYPLGRMSLAVVMMHWLVNKTFAASRHGLYYTSVLNMVIDFVATAVFSYLLALPVTLFLDIPMQQFYRVVAS